jgi:hypothetical protein
MNHKIFYATTKYVYPAFLSALIARNPPSVATDVPFGGSLSSSPSRCILFIQNLKSTPFAANSSIFSLKCPGANAGNTAPPTTTTLISISLIAEMAAKKKAEAEKKAKEEAEAKAKANEAVDKEANNG